MAHRFILFACLNALFLQNAYSQAIPNCGCQSQVTLTETCLQNPVLVNQPCQPVIQPSIVAGPCCQTVAPCELEYVGSYAVPQQVIIQEDSIANNLANTLQLLIVSNLLGNTLPFNNLDVATLAQPGLLASTLPLAGPAVQVAPLGLPALVGGCGCGCGGVCGCGCGCGYGGLSYVF